MDKEKKSFEILVRENSRMLTVFLSTRIREQAVIDDLFQETMLVAWKRLPDYDLDRQGVEAPSRLRSGSALWSVVAGNCISSDLRLFQEAISYPFSYVRECQRIDR